MERPILDPSRQHFEVKSYEDVIKKGNTPGADSYVTRKKRIFLYFLISFVFVGTIVWCVISFNKYKKQEEALTLGNGYYDINGDWRSFDKPELGKLSKPSIDTPDSKEQVVVPKIEPSNEILNSDILSGNFQIGDYVYTLPVKMSDMLDTGLELVDEEGNSISGDEFVDAKTRGKAILKYDEYTYFYVGTYDTEKVNLRDSTVVTAYQFINNNLWNPNSQYLYLPGGLHVELDGKTAAGVYDVGDGLLQVTEMPSVDGKESGKQYNYNGKYDFSWKEHNFLMFTVISNQVDLVKAYKNR